MTITDEEFTAANRRAADRLAATPVAKSARYDARAGRVVIDLSNGIMIGFRPQDAEGLEAATPKQLHMIEISPSGFGLHFPKCDADLYLPTLLQGFLGSPRWMAARLGSIGGRARSRAKTAAVRRNGRLGGRPVKKVRAA